MASPSLLGWGSCVCLVLTALFLCYSLRQLAPLLDQRLAPGEVPLTDPASFARRLHNHSDMPQICETVVPTDVVANVSIAAECVAWCHESLGPGSALPYAFSPGHWMRLRSTNSTVRGSFSMCWKAETAARTFSWFPSVWQMYVAAMAYGSISGIALVHALWKKTPEEGDVVEAQPAAVGDEGWYTSLKVWSTPEDDVEESSLVSADSRSEVLGPCSDGFHDGGPAVSPFVASKRCKMPFCCIPVDSDLQGSTCELRLSALLMLFEPTLDVLSVLIFLRSGQPIYAAIVGVATTLSWILACDPLQIYGAAAMADSFVQGFPTQGLLRHKKVELLESAGATMVQCYALLSMDIASASLSNSITLSVSASISLTLSLPDTCKAIGVLVTNTANNYYAAEESKRRLGFFGRYIMSLLCMMFAWIAVVCKTKRPDTQFVPLWLVPLQHSWSDSRAYELWGIALVLLLFRAAVLCAIPLACGGLLLSIHQGWISSAFT